MKQSLSIAVAQPRCAANEGLEVVEQEGGHWLGDWGGMRPLRDPGATDDE